MIKEFIFHTLTKRILYIVAAFSSAKVIAFAASGQVQGILSHAGVMFQVTDPDKLKAYLLGVILVFGEVVYHWIDTKFILPHT